MSNNTQEKSASGGGEIEGKQQTGPASDAVQGATSGESLVPKEVSSNVGVKSARGSELEPPEKTNPTAGREASYVYDVLNMPSTVDTTGMRPNPQFEVKQNTFGQDLQEQSKSVDEFVVRKESSDMYKDELAKIEKMVKGKVTMPTSMNTSGPPRSEKDGSEFRLSEDASKASLFSSPWQWIPQASPETLQKNMSAISERKDVAVRVANESILNTGGDFTFFRERRLFANERNTFFMGKYKQQLVIVKKINSSAPVSSSSTGSDPLWVSIAKRIFYSQQLEEDKAIARAQTMGKESSGGESTGASITFTDEPDLSSTSSNGVEKSSSVRQKPPRPFARPFLQVYEIFRIEADRSLMLFLEIASKKSLHYHVKHRTPLDVAQARLWSAQVLDGISYLANHGVVHRAIRLEHILLDGRENARLIGWRRAVALSSSGTLTRRERRVRSNNHLPPEAFQGSYEPSAVDLWSWGVVLCALASFRYPFNVRSQRPGGVEEEWALFKARHPASGHPQVTALLDTLFLNDPEKRATLQSIQMNVWFGGALPAQLDTQPPVGKSAEKVAT